MRFDVRRLIRLATITTLAVARRNYINLATTLHPGSSTGMIPTVKGTLWAPFTRHIHDFPATRRISRESRLTNHDKSAKMIRHPFSWSFPQSSHVPTTSHDITSGDRGAKKMSNHG